MQKNVVWFLWPTKYEILSSQICGAMYEMYLFLLPADDAQEDNSDDMDFQSAKKRFRTPTGVMLLFYSYRKSSN